VPASSAKAMRRGARSDASVCEEVEGTTAQRWPRDGTRAPSGGEAASLRAHKEKQDGARGAVQ
jgi:hypothetical protein